MRLLRIAYFLVPLLLSAGILAAAEMPVPNSILPPGMRSMSVTMTRDKARQSDRRFIRRLLSPAGKGRLE